MKGKPMLNVGKQIRYNRIVNPETGKTLMVPLDHGIILGPLAGIEDPAKTIRDVVAGGADAVIFNAGIASSVYQEYMNRCGAVFNLTNIITAEEDLTLIGTVEYAVRQGADGVSVQIQIGSKHERHMIENVRIVAEECSKWNMPLLIMMYPTEELLKKRGSDAELLATRAGAEMGADIVKTSYTGDKKTFKALVDCCPVPVVIAGGPKAEKTMDVLKMVEDVMDCGAAGVALGRNVWQSANPTKMTAALAGIIHGGKKASEVYPKK